MTASKVSAAEKARREAQSNADKGVESDVDVDMWGVTVAVSPGLFRELDVVGDIFVTQDEAEPEEERMAAMVRVAMRICGSRWRRVMGALKAANDGHAPLEALGEIVQKAIEGVGSPESSAS